MERLLVAGLVVLLAMSVAQGHFPFVVPDPQGQTAKLVFSDSLEPDSRVKMEKLAGTKLTLRVGGKDVPLQWKKAESYFALDIPGTGDRVVYGETVYGVLQKGDAKPFKLVYYPKTILGNPLAPEAVIGEKQPLEIVPVGEPGKVRFRVLARGKPLAQAEVSVLLPDGNRKAVTTDQDGLTPSFEVSGRVGVYARQTLSTPGEHAGLKYEEVRFYATLVCDLK